MSVEQKIFFAYGLVVCAVAYINRRKPMASLSNVLVIISFLGYFIFSVVYPITISTSSSQLDRFSDTYCTSKNLHFVTSNDSVADRLVDDKKRLIVRCVDSQDRVIEFQPEAPVISPLRLKQ